jgi:hypothetical protein
MVLGHGVDEQKALASSCILELTVSDEGKERMVSEGILIPLVKVLSWGLHCLKQEKATLKGANTTSLSFFIESRGSITYSIVADVLETLLPLIVLYRRPCFRAT